MTEEDIEALMCKIFPECKPMSAQEKEEVDKKLPQKGYKNMPFPNIIHNREFLNIEVDTLLSIENQFYITLDRANKEIYHAEYLMGTIYHGTTARLVKVSQTLATLLEEHFHIVLNDYGIEVKSLDAIVISLKNGEYDYE